MSEQKMREALELIMKMTSYEPIYMIAREALAAAPAAPSCSQNAETRTRQPELVDEIADREHVCEWQEHDNVHMPGTWEGSCMVMWPFIDGGPAENEMRYCPKCGGKIMITAPASQEPKK